MKTVFVVVGTTGEYSDRTEWLVAAYADDEKAKTHAQLAKAKAAELFLRRHDSNCPSNEYDADYRTDYTGTDYTVAAVPVLKLVPRPEPS